MNEIFYLVIVIIVYIAWILLMYRLREHIDDFGEFMIVLGVGFLFSTAWPYSALIAAVIVPLYIIYTKFFKGGSV